MILPRRRMLPHLLRRQVASARPSALAGVVPRAVPLAHQPCGLGQFLYQPDEQPDHESDEAEPDQPRKKTGVAQPTDQVEANAADEAANPSARGALDDVFGR